MTPRRGLARARFAAVSLACAAHLVACGANGSGGTGGGGGDGRAITTPVAPQPFAATGTTGSGYNGQEGSPASREGSDPETGGGPDGNAGVGGAPDEQAVSCKAQEAVVYGVSVDDSNSMGSPAYARGLLRAGLAPEPARVRPSEFMNYYRAGFEVPASGSAAAPAAVRVHATLVERSAEGEGEGAPRSYDLHVALVAPKIAPTRALLTIALDASGSMRGEGIVRARQAVSALVDALEPNDLVSVLRWSAAPETLVEATSKADLGPALADALAVIEPDGESNMEEALARAYALASAHALPGGVNRVVVISDGGAKVGEFSLKHVTSIADETSDEVQLTGVGVGSAAGYRDDVMNQLTDAGRGAYVFLDSADEAKRVLRDRFDEVMRVAVTGLRVKITLPDYLEIDGASSTPASVSTDTSASQNLASGDEMNFILRLVPTAELNDLCVFGPDAVVRVAVAADGTAPDVTLPAEETFSLEEIARVLPGAGPTDEPPLTYHRARAFSAFARALAAEGEGEAAKPLLEEARAAVEDARAATPVSHALADDPSLDEIASLLELHPLLK